MRDTCSPAAKSEKSRLAVEAELKKRVRHPETKVDAASPLASRPGCRAPRPALTGGVATLQPQRG